MRQLLFCLLSIARFFASLFIQCTRPGVSKYVLLLSGQYCLAAQPAATTQPFSDALTTAIQKGDAAQFQAVCKDWHASGAFSPGELNWNYNALMSLEPNAVLLVQNDDDARPLWVIQQVLNIRKEVSVLSLSILNDPTARDFFSKGKNIAFKGASQNELIRNLLANSAQTPVYLGVMLEKSIIQQEQNNLYLTGLAMKFSATPFDNLATLKEHYEKDFLLDYLRQDFSTEPSAGKIASMNLNYLPSFLLLYRYYSTKGDDVHADDLRKMSLQIARAADKEPEVSAFFAPEPVVKPGAVAPKSIDKTMKKVKGSLWASSIETSNEQYELFLTDLLKNKEYELLDRCKVLKTDWRTLLPDSMKSYPDAVLFKHGHPDDPKMPVQQITHEAAQRYCAWLTAAYNASPEKKKFKKVLFRLPTEQEWMDAARAGRKDTPYPWGGYYVRNVKGCYLLNLNATKPCGDCKDQRDANDGGYFTVETETYFPNDFGLYNMSGNVAEMIQDAGKSKGGSWQDTEFLNQIPQSKTYTGPGPGLGFRVFMDVIEE